MVKKKRERGESSPALHMEIDVVKKKRERGGASYLCPKCYGPSHVIVTKREEHSTRKRLRVFRYRECMDSGCGNRFFTCEIMIPPTSFATFMRALKE